MPRRRYSTAHEVGQFVYVSDRSRKRRVPRPEWFRRGLQVHARLEAVHLTRQAVRERVVPWDCVLAGVIRLLVLGVALWTH